MKIKSFRIKNYKSIIDTKESYLWESDNILILAWQNESWKSSILEALNDYEKGELSEDCTKRKSSKPFVSVNYKLNKSEKVWGIVLDVDFSDFPFFLKFINSLRELNFYIDFNESKNRVLKELIDFDYEKDFSPSSSELDETVLNNEKQQFNTKKDEFLNKFFNELWKYTPEIVLFNDLSDLLPSKIPLKILTSKSEDFNWYKAVRNYEKILWKQLSDFLDNSNWENESLKDEMDDYITVDFNEYWKQQIFWDNKINIKIRYYQWWKEEDPYFEFFILTRTWEYLKPSQRSAWLKWFLSFYLELKSRKDEWRPFLLLLDEPWLFLHSKAQNDIKKLLDEISEIHQIIYSTHSPYLIDTNKLNRVKLIINDLKEWTCIEKITTQKTWIQADALKPIIDAMWIELSSWFSHTSNNNVIVEWITDLYYFEWMKKILWYDKKDFSFIPAASVNKINIIISFCLWWGLSWCAIMDWDTQSNNEYKNIKTSFWDIFLEKILKLEDCNWVEDMFQSDELNKLSNDFKFDSTKIINSKNAKNFWGKEIIGRFFLDKINSSKLKKEDFSKETIEKFDKVFTFIQNEFNL